MDFIKIAKEVFDLEIEELHKVKESIGEEINQAVEMIFNTKGRVVITGIGKSGIVGQKIAASLASTGTKAFFMNSAEGLHGDLGMIYKDDVVIAISNSGSSQEVLSLLPSLKRIGCQIIAMTGNRNSPLAKASELILNIGVEKEACPMNLAPTSSTTATLVMGDALVVALIEKREFKPERFAVYHPGGALGRRLLTRVRDLMHTDVPFVNENDYLKDLVYEISSKRLGMTMVQDNNGHTVGIITDGDIRRKAFQFNNLQELKAKDIMTTSFKTISKNEMANFALEMMDHHKISSLAVAEDRDSKDVIGIITMHDLFDFKY
ncbi:KpsF/GutQ family sugar-phosphate isomerase [Gottfriedia acidiceleris]|uniref:KpsF/GutQ family sugar-phosphate isomerase n=1 Tax=Gottfriedia acidiceleris TaxID=371036 RepID=UPI002FFD9C78